MHHLYHIYQVSHTSSHTYAKCQYMYLVTYTDTHCHFNKILLKPINTNIKFKPLIPSAKYTTYTKSQVSSLHALYQVQNIPHMPNVTSMSFQQSHVPLFTKFKIYHISQPKSHTHQVYQLYKVQHLPHNTT